MKTDDPLLQRLARLPVPPPDPTARDRALHHAAVALRAARGVEPGVTRPWASFLFGHGRAFAGGAAVAVVLVCLWMTLGVRRPAGDRPPSLAVETSVLRQMELLFGPQLDAVVEPPGKAPDIRLSADGGDTIQPSLAQPVLIQFHRAGSGTTRVLSYSGRVVCVTLGERRMCFEPLVTGRDEVLLLGEAFCWSRGQPPCGPNGYRVTARLLPRS